MKIKTQVGISLIVFVILAVLISFSIYSSNNQIQEITKKQIIIDEIKMGSFELYYLENDYILHGGTRPVDQWHSKYDMLSGQLEELTITDPSQQAVFNTMSDNFKNIQTTFSNLLAMTGSEQGTKTSPASQELKEFVTTTLTVQTQTLMFSSSELSKLVKTESTEVQQRNTLIISLSLAALMFFVLLNYLVINRSVLRSLSELQKGTEQIGSGDLDTKIETGDNDELGDLSRAFNAMTSNLKTVLTSKSELEKEVADRKRAEEALRETTGYLQNLFDYANAPIITWDTGFRITRFNHAFERLTGRSQEEVLGKTLDILFPGESRHASMALIQKTLEGERWETVEIPILNTDGIIKTVLWNSANVLDPHGKLTATIAQGFDITDRKRAEQSAKESLELYQTLSESAKDIIFICNPAGNLQYFNKNGATVFGVSVDDLIGKTLEQAFPPEIAKEQRRQLDLVLESKKPLFTEINILLPKINLWLDVQLIPIFTEQGTIKSVMGVARDITKRKRAEKELQQSEMKFHTMADFTVDWEYWHAPDDRLVYISPSCEVIAGYSPGEFTADPALLTRIIYPDDISLFSDHIHRIHENAERGNLDFRIVKKNGEIRWLAHRCMPVHDRDGTYLGQRVSNRDITERKRAEEALRESEERFRIIAQNITDVIHEWDLKDRVDWYGDIDGLLGYPNGGFPRTLSGWAASLHPDDKDRVWKNVEDHLKGISAYNVEYRIKTKDGEWRWWSARGTVIKDERGEPHRWIGAISDITLRKQAEESLKKYSERLEESVSERTRELREAQDQLVKKEKLAILGKLAGGVGHELRNPLGAIKNAAYFLNMALEKPDPDVKEMVELINKEVARSEDIISSLLDFARPKTLTLRKESVNTAINDALKRNPVPEHVTVINNLDETLPKIPVDPDKLLQVFNNIISNAFQAMPEGGKLTITSKQSGPEWVSIAFADTGVGISVENMKKLFEPLFTTKIKGIGLGMVVTKTIVEAHGGHIDVQSEEGKGTTITVNLPMSGRRVE